MVFRKLPLKDKAEHVLRATLKMLHNRRVQDKADGKKDAIVRLTREEKDALTFILRVYESPANAKLPPEDRKTKLTSKEIDELWKSALKKGEDDEEAE